MSPEEKLKMDLMLQEKTPISEDTALSLKTEGRYVHPYSKDKYFEAIKGNKKYTFKLPKRLPEMKYDSYFPYGSDMPRVELKEDVPNKYFSSKGYIVNPNTGTSYIQEKVPENKSLERKYLTAQDEFTNIEKDLSPEARDKYIKRLIELEKKISKNQGIL